MKTHKVYSQGQVIKIVVKNMMESLAPKYIWWETYDLPEIQLGVSHKQIDGTPIQSFRADLRVLEQIKVEYEVMPGWLCDISSIRRYSKLPKTARQYVERIEELVGVPIHYIRIGPGRDVLV
ncbi:Adenylosuccinate synthetase [Forsythia ovata]|uniref:Adenylosuccinate synthetase n=1 Tax=Forsythia ovata TaxID=205694 RepID=A0ABD1TS20_9LAMI